MIRSTLKIAQTAMLNDISHLHRLFEHDCGRAA
jgi:hypothetical protein